MTEDTHRLRREVRDLLLDLDHPFAPGDPDATRHAYRLRFGIARVEEQAHAAVMQSALYSRARYEVAMSVLRADIDRARALLRSSRPAVERERAQAWSESLHSEMDGEPAISERRAA